MLTVRQDGSDVIVVGSGSANTNSLPSPTESLDYTNVLWENQIYAGPDAFNGSTPQYDVNLWDDINGPLSFNTDPLIIATTPSSGTGDLFGIYIDTVSNKPLLVLPFGYVSGNSLNGTSRFNNFTPEEVAGYLRLFRSLLLPGGEIRFYEYLASRRLRAAFSSPSEWRRLTGVGRVLTAALASGTSQSRIVWCNLPPAVMHVLRP